MNLRKFLIGLLVRTRSRALGVAAAASLAAALFASLAAPAGAHAPPPGAPMAAPGPGPEEMDPIEFQLLPPELVMRHQGEIRLRPEQRETIIAELQQTQADLVPLEFDLNDAQQKLVELLSQARVDEEQALLAADRLTELEGRVKHRHLTLLIHIKNILDEEQQQHLREIRRQEWARERERWAGERR